MDTRIKRVLSCVQAAPQAVGPDGGRESPAGGNGPLTPAVGHARIWRTAPVLCRQARCAAVDWPSTSALPRAPAATCPPAPAVARGLGASCICCALPLPAVCAARQGCLSRYADQSLFLPLQALRQGQAVDGAIGEMAVSDPKGKGKARAAPEVSCRTARRDVRVPSSCVVPQPLRDVPAAGSGVASS